MTNDEIRATQIKEYTRCKSDAQYFIHNYCYTFNSKETDPTKPKIFKMRPYPHLIDLINQLEAAIKNKQPIIIEKSREMCISWTIMAWQLHKAMFTEGWMSLNISRKESEVEDTGKTPKSLFGRLDFMYKHLPSFLRMRAENPFLTFKVQSNNSYISGESANPNAGRDTQYSFILIDEAGMVSCLDEMWQSVNNSADVICLNSTPPREGMGHKFSQLRFLKNSNFKILRYHWSEHPEKDSEWYVKKTANMTEEDIARELEINYEKSANLKIFHEFDAEIHVPSFNIPYDPRIPLYMSWDFGLDDPEFVLFMQITVDCDGKRRLNVLDEYEKRNLLTTEHAANLKKKLMLMNFSGTYKSITCHGDPEGSKRERTSRQSVCQQYKLSGFDISILEKGIDERRRSVKVLLKARDSKGMPRLRINPKCEKLIECLQNHQRKTKDVEDARRTKWTHGATCLEFFCVNEFPVIQIAAVTGSLDPEDTSKKELLPTPVQRRGSLIW